MAARSELLTTEEMVRADALAIEGGVSSLTLMENAGRAVAAAAGARAHRGARIAVVCGPGNNGGDGFVAARHLKAMGYQVRLFLLGERALIKGDAAHMAGRFEGELALSIAEALDSADLIVDALFGAGLARPLEGAAAAAVTSINASAVPVVAVDVPSGLDGNTGRGEGPVVRASSTVTFFRKKPGHVLMPGRRLCGEVTVADIGIPERVLDEIRPMACENGIETWRAQLPKLSEDGHKYSRGHAVVVSGPAHRTGAARLGARGALRIGAGLVTVASPPSAVVVNAQHLSAIMLQPFEGVLGLADLLRDKRKNAVLIGPGRGIGARTAAEVLTILASKAAVVLDADALTSFSEAEYGPTARGFGFMGAVASAPPPNAATLFSEVEKREAPVVMTPHEGEFERLFGEIAGSKLVRAREAARRSHAIIVLKGADTVIAAPGGRAAINSNAPPWLATAGSGDVLSGCITGLLAQAMPPFEAACGAVWLHGECANRAGLGLIAEDLPEILPSVLRDIV